MTDRSTITRDAAEALAAAAEAMLTNLWRYAYEYRENADEGSMAEDRLRGAVRRYREASGTEALGREHDCLVSVPTSVGGGAWAEMAIPGVTTWRCGCGQEWVWQPGGWDRLADAVSRDAPAKSVASDEGWTAARALATQVVEDRIGRPGMRELALRVLGDGLPEPPQVRVEYKTLCTISHERGCPNGRVIPDRGTCPACGAEVVVYESETPSLTVTPSIEPEAAGRNVGGDAGNLEAGM